MSHFNASFSPRVEDLLSKLKIPVHSDLFFIKLLEEVTSTSIPSWKGTKSNGSSTRKVVFRTRETFPILISMFHVFQASVCRPKKTPLQLSGNAIPAWKMFFLMTPPPFESIGLSLMVCLPNAPALLISVPVTSADVEPAPLAAPPTSKNHHREVMTFLFLPRNAHLSWAGVSRSGAKARSISLAGVMDTKLRHSLPDHSRRLTTLLMSMRTSRDASLDVC